MIGSFTERHVLPIMTPAAILRCIGWTDFHQLAASFFRFALQLTEKSRPCRIMNAFGQTMGMRHAVHLEVFHANDAEAVNDVTTLLLGEVVPFELDTLMHTSHSFPVLLGFRRAFRQLAMFALCL
jgi:hypothetical protein